MEVKTANSCNIWTSVSPSPSPRSLCSGVFTSRTEIIYLLNGFSEIVMDKFKMKLIFFLNYSTKQMISIQNHALTSDFKYKSHSKLYKIMKSKSYILQFKCPARLVSKF
jgi:hypothetical protein